MSESKKEIQSLNADDMDVQELDDRLLDDAAGGAEEEVVACSGYSCGNYWC